jgi:TPR repeat protein
MKTMPKINRLMLILLPFGLAVAISARADCPPPGPDSEAHFQACRSLAESGDPVAQRQLGTLYHQGAGVARSDAEALVWYRRAAAGGDVAAVYNLGVMYDSGNGTAQDHVEAARWYREAADKGDGKAMYNLGLLYEYGHGVAQDYGEAMRLYRQAAELGEPWAQFALALLYDKGQGVERDPVRAYMWFDIVGDGHEHAVHNRDSVGEELTAAQIEEALELARQWRAQRPQLFEEHAAQAAP